MPIFPNTIPSITIASLTEAVVEMYDADEIGRHAARRLFWHLGLEVPTRKATVTATVNATRNVEVEVDLDDYDVADQVDLDSHDDLDGWDVQSRQLTDAYREVEIEVEATREVRIEVEVPLFTSDENVLDDVDVADEAGIDDEWSVDEVTVDRVEFI